MPAFTTNIDIINRALTHCRKERIVSLTEHNPQAREAAFVYDKLREAELRRNTWRFAIRRNLLRAVGIDTALWTPPDWAIGTTYAFAKVVAYGGDYWSSKVASNVGNTPQVGAYWRRYFGPRALDLYDGDTTYASGEIVLVPATWSGVTTYDANAVVNYSGTWYVSLQGSNLNQQPDTETDYWVAWSTTGRGEETFGVTDEGSPIPLTYPGTPSVYLSLYDGNEDNPVDGTSNWLSLSGTVAALAVLYPIGTGPSQQSSTANVFRLPHGFLRQAPSDPRAGINPALGAPAGPWADDWLFEGQYIVSHQSSPLLLRYVADVIDVPDMDPMFCEGLASRIATEVAPILVDQEFIGLTINVTRKRYREVMGEARTVNGIETGPVEPVEDDYVACRY